MKTVQVLKRLWQRPELLALAAVTLIGAILRLAEISAPLTHDELSAIIRVRFDNIAELIQEGVKTSDTHPAGVQFFLWLWCKLFGTSAVVVRLPFVLMGIGCIPLAYNIARRWYGSDSALLAAIVVAFSQYTVYYSMLARPYIAGLFFVLLMLHFWTGICVEHKHTVGQFTGYALTAACCAYTQYFCTLTALLVGLAGLFFVERDKVWRYILASACAMLLFLPHLGITLYQLFEMKGVGGWLGAPHANFFWYYLRYLTHHSYTMLAIFIFYTALMFSKQSVLRNKKLMIVSFALFLLPLVAGYSYSRLVNPVLQYSVLLFSYPFLLLAFCGAIGSKRPLLANLSAVAIGTALLLTLFFVRKHYDVINREYIESSANLINQARDEYGTDNVMCLFDITDRALHYYNNDINTQYTPDTPMDSILSKSSAKYAATSKLLEPEMTAVQRNYPYLIEYRQCVATEVCLFSKTPDNSMPWDGKVIKCGNITPNDEFTVLMDTVGNDISDKRFFMINAEVDGIIDKDLYLVMETHVFGRKVDYRNIPLSNTSNNIALKQELNIKSRLALRHSRIKVYLWNPEGKPHNAANYHISVTPDNQYIYSILEEL